MIQNVTLFLNFDKQSDSDCTYLCFTDYCALDRQTANLVGDRCVPSLLVNLQIKTVPVAIDIRSLSNGDAHASFGM